MARKITMFELYFDGAHFGPTTGESPEEDVDEEMAVETDEEYDEEVSGSPIRPALAAVGAVAVVSAAGFLAARRFRGGEDEEFDHEESGHAEFDEAEHSGETVME